MKKMIIPIVTIICVSITFFIAIIVSLMEALRIIETMEMNNN